MLDLRKPLNLDRVVRIAITLAICWGLIWLVRYLSDVLIPFAIAVLFAYLVNPFIIFIQKFIKNRGVAVVSGITIIVVLITFAGWLIVPQIYHEFRHMGQVIYGLIYDPETAAKFSQYLPPNLLKNIEEFLKRDEVRAIFTSDSLMNLLGKFGEKILPGLWSLISGTAAIITALLGIVIIFMYLVFLLIGYDKMSGNWKNLIPGNYRTFISELVEDFFEAMNVYFRNQALIALIIAILFAISFSIINLPMAIAMGLFLGLLNMVPYLQVAGTIPCFFLAFMHAVETGRNPWIYIGIVALIFVVIQQIQDWILTPKIMGKVTGMNPALIILSICVWGKLLGFFGLVIALPLTFLIIAYYRRFIKMTDHQLGPIIMSEDDKA